MDLRAFETTKSRFDRGAPRWKEALWYATKMIFFLSSFPFPSKWKVRLLRWFGARIGRGVVIHPRVNITFPWRLEVGDHTWLGEEAFILTLDTVSIGSHCCISQRVFLCSGAHDFHSPTFDLKTAPIQVRDHCWIAAQAFLAPGVCVGEHSLVAAGSIVIDEIPAHSLAAGNPALVQKHFPVPSSEP